MDHSIFKILLHWVAVVWEANDESRRLRHTHTHAANGCRDQTTVLWVLTSRVPASRQISEDRPEGSAIRAVDRQIKREFFTRRMESIE